MDHLRNIYCGIGKVPSGKKKGSMKECVEKKQVRLYGLNKVDDRLIMGLDAQKKNQAQKDAIFKKMFILKGKRSKLVKALEVEKDKAKKEELKKEIKKLRSEITKLNSQWQTPPKKEPEKSKKSKSDSDIKKIYNDMTKVINSVKQSKTKTINLNKFEKFSEQLRRAKEKQQSLQRKKDIEKIQKINSNMKKAINSAKRSKTKSINPDLFKKFGEQLKRAKPKNISYGVVPYKQKKIGIDSIKVTKKFPKYNPKKFSFDVETYGVTPYQQKETGIDSIKVTTKLHKYNQKKFNIKIPKKLKVSRDLEHKIKVVSTSANKAKMKKLTNINQKLVRFKKNKKETTATLKKDINKLNKIIIKLKKPDSFGMVSDMDKSLIKQNMKIMKKKQSELKRLNKIFNKNINKLSDLNRNLKESMRLKNTELPRLRKLIGELERSEKEFKRDQKIYGLSETDKGLLKQLSASIKRNKNKLKNLKTKL